MGGLKVFIEGGAEKVFIAAKFLVRPYKLNSLFLRPTRMVISCMGARGAVLDLCLNRDPKVKASPTPNSVCRNGGRGLQNKITSRF